MPWQISWWLRRSADGLVIAFAMSADGLGVAVSFPPDGSLWILDGVSMLDWIVKLA